MPYDKDKGCWKVNEEENNIEECIVEYTKDDYINQLEKALKNLKDMEFDSVDEMIGLYEDLQKEWLKQMQKIKQLEKALELACVVIKDIAEQDTDKTISGGEYQIMGDFLEEAQKELEGGDE